jgi:IS30 family transposase
MPGRNKHLTGHEITFIKANYHNMSIKMMARAMERHHDTISRYLKDHGMKAAKHPTPSRYTPNGSITIFSRNGTPYLHIKLNDRYKLLHHHIWESLIGEIPPGYVISFKDGDRFNCAPDNLYIVSKRKWMQRNSINNWPSEIRELIVAANQLKGKINERLEQIEERTF